MAAKYSLPWATISKFEMNFDSDGKDLRFEIAFRFGFNILNFFIWFLAFCIPFCSGFFIITTWLPMPPSFLNESLPHVP